MMFGTVVAWAKSKTADADDAWWSVVRSEAELLMLVMLGTGWKTSSC